ncbi:Rrf2 family transcriptional regulator [bacterium]|nr:Rrf2 family transcriptional regulator [bacterium]
MLTTTTEYAIRALVYLSKGDKDGFILGRDLSKMADIPSNYMAKILVTLNRSSILEATRGRGGGYKLRRPADEIYLMEVAKILEGNAAIPECILDHTKICTDKKPCGAHSGWRKVRKTYIHFLENTTIADLATNHELAKAATNL